MSTLCLLCVSLRAGGTERIVSRMATYLRNHHNVYVLLLSRETPFYDLPSDVGLIQPEITSKRSAGWRWYPYMFSYIFHCFNKIRPDLVLCFGESIAPVILPIAKICSCRTLVFNRANPLASLRGRRGLVSPLIYPVAYKVVLQTSRASQVMKSRYRFSKFAVLPNPIQVPEEVATFENRPKRIVTIGTLGGEKNQQALISAFAAMEECNSWNLDIVGDGPDRDFLENLAVKLSVSNNVFFHGQRHDVYKYLYSARVFALTSLTEGFPNALAEALSAGCACISYDCPTGPSELINHNENGLLVPNNNEKELKISLNKLVKNKLLQKSLSINARKMITRYSQDSVFEKLDCLIEESLSTK